MSDGERLEDLRDGSDRLLQRLGELKALERRKREEQVSSPAFHDLVEAVDDKSREVFRAVEEQSELAGGFERRQDATIEDV